MSQQPAVGRIVHYMARGSADGVFPPVCRAAVITEVPQPATDDFNHERIGVAVLNPTGLFFDRGLAHDEDGKAGGTWHWPEYVPGYDLPSPTGTVPQPDRTPGPAVP